MRLFWSFKRKKTTLSYKPIRLWIEPTSICNLRCIMCPNKDLKKEEKGYMDMELFKKVIDEASGFIFDIYLHHRGESLLHPKLSDMISYAHEKGVTTKLHTNGTLLDEQKASEIIRAGLDQLSFSFDGYDKATYESIRTNANFEKTVANIVKFLEVKKELNSRKPFTILELIDFPDLYKNTSAEKKAEFLNRFKGLPLDKIEVKEMHNWAGEVGESRKKGTFSPCTFLWQALIILWDGMVLPCTQDFHAYYAVGNVKESSLARIWNDEKMVRLREKFIRRDIEDLKTCAFCDRVWRDQVLGIPKEFLWKFLLNRMN